MYVSLKRKYPVFLILLLFPFVGVSAQSNSYSLATLVDSARHYLPLFMEKKATISSYKALVTDARHSFMPLARINDQVNIGSANSVAGAYLPVAVNVSVSGAIRDESDYQAAAGNVGVGIISLVGGAGGELPSQV